MTVACGLLSLRKSSLWRWTGRELPQRGRPKAGFWVFMLKQRWTRGGRALIVFEGGVVSWKLGFWVETLAGEQI